VAALLATLLVTLVVTLLLGALPALAAPQVDRRTLANGLTVVLQEDHAAPVVAVQVWVKAGSRYETEAESGITHQIEHMIFKGTAKRHPGELAKAIESSGGYINAYTSFDQTVYHTVLASRFLPLGLDVLCDAVTGSIFDPQELEREKKVVIEEIRQRDDDPQVRLSKALFAAAYKVHPYRRPVIGTEQNVAGFTRADIMAYLAKWYRPDNMVLAVAGDFSAKDTWPLVEKTFGQAHYLGQNAPGAPKAAVPAEPAQEATRVVSLGGDVHEGYLEVAFHIPDVAHDDSYALDMLAEVLGSGDSSRLYRKVKQEKELVHSVDASSFTPLDPGLFSLSASLEAKLAPEALEAMLAESCRLKSGVPSADEMAKARLNIEASFLRARETVEGRARQIGYFQTVRGDWRLEDEYLARIRAVTPEDVRRVARAYLKPENMTVAMLAPKGQEGAMSGAIVEAASKRAFAAPPALAEKAARTFKWRLANGIRLVVKENPGTGTVAVNAACLGGQRYEDPKHAGIAAFAAGMLTKGTKTKTAAQIASMVDSMAAGLSGFSGRNSMGLTGNFLSERMDEGLALFAEVLRRPSFPASEVAKMRSLVLAAVKAREDNLTRVAMDLFNAALYGPHPYGRQLMGTNETVKAIGPKDLAAFWGRYVRPAALVVTVVGDVDAEHVRERMTQLLGGWRGAAPKAPRIPAEAGPQRIVRAGKERDERNQVHMLIGFPGTTIASPDRYPLAVLDAALSSQGGRLFDRLRDHLSLAYTVSCFSQEGLEPGSFAVYISTSPEKREQAVSELMEQLRLTLAGITPQELDRARRFVVGNYEIGLQTNGAQASEMALDELYGLGYDYSPRYVAGIEKVSVEDVQRAAGKYIHLDRYVQAEVGPGPGRKAAATGAVMPASGPAVR
jgi:zinc protease